MKKKLLNKKVKGQYYLCNKYGVGLGLLCVSKLYIDTHKRNTKEMIHSLSMWVNSTNEKREEAENIILKELELI